PGEAPLPTPDPQRAAQRRAGLGAPRLLPGSPSPAQPSLRGSFLLRTPPLSPPPRWWLRLRDAGARGMDLAHSRCPPRLHLLGAVRGQPAPAGRAGPGAWRRPAGKPAPGRSRPAPGAGNLRGLRAADDGPLPRQPGRGPTCLHLTSSVIGSE